MGDDQQWFGVAFTYAPGDHSVCLDSLKGFSGIIQMDGYAGYNRLLKRSGEGVVLVSAGRTVDSV